MKKITLLFLFCILIAGLEAQIVYQTVLTDNFETTDGYPSNFSVKGQAAWVTLNAANNPYPYTGTIWKDVFSDAKPTSKKTYSIAVVAENRTGGTGSQCLKFTIKNETFTDTAPNDTIFSVRWRGADGKIGFTGIESATKYEATFWARTDGENKNVFLNTKLPNTYLTLTSNWQKFTIERYTTGVTSTALGIDFYNTLYPAPDNTSSFLVYIDELTIKQRLIAYTHVATDTTANSFKANWDAVVGATMYNVIVEKSDGANTPTWIAIAGSPFSAGNATNYVVSGLDANSPYRYRVTATDGSVTTVESNNTFITTKTISGLNDLVIKSVYTQNGVLSIDLNSEQKISVFSVSGQLLFEKMCHTGINNFNISFKGVYIVKVGSDSRKIVF
jgi:hypothetical protein